MNLRKLSLWVALSCAWALGCGNAADNLGVGAECTSEDQCLEALTCLKNFKGGYCGLSGCTADAECPEGSLCVTEGGTNYCFRGCEDKSQCNVNRTVDNESNCSSNITRVGTNTFKACVPPTG
jgi:hypothetical protein